MIRKVNACRLWQFGPFQQQVTYQARVGGTDETTAEVVVKAHRKKVTKEEVNGDFKLLMLADTVWQIVAALLPGVEPAPEDSLVDADGKKWIVLKPTIQYGGAVYNLICRRGT